ncbi:MAG: flavin reductase family protein [Acidobacteriota bacterium]|nr:flavin reductase family protein [Acidobacteriota bacterium]
MTVDPASTDPRNIYKLLIGAIVPRPIAFVSSLSAEGVRNLAPFSFFTAVSANPPVICFSPMINSAGRAKDTLTNIAATGEFVVNIVSESFLPQMNQCSAEFPPDVDEFTVSGLSPIPSERVKPSRVAESQIHLECTLVQIVEVSANPLGGSLVLGEVKLFHIADALFQNFTLDPGKLHAVGRMAGSTYARTTDRFELARPVLR